MTPPETPCTGQENCHNQKLKVSTMEWSLRNKGHIGDQPLNKGCPLYKVKNPLFRQYNLKPLRKGHSFRGTVIAHFIMHGTLPIEVKTSILRIHWPTPSNLGPSVQATYYTYAWQTYLVSQFQTRTVLSMEQVAMMGFRMQTSIPVISPRWNE